MGKDYFAVKNKILQRYLVDLPEQESYPRHAFLLSDMYHFLKETSGETDYSKLQTVLTAWVNDPMVDSIPISALQGFMAHPYFGACNHSFVDVTKNEFLMLPYKNAYDAGKFGEKFDTAELRGEKTPLAEALFQMLKEKNLAMFSKVAAIKPGINTPLYDAYGAPMIPPVAIAMSNIYDPFVEDLSTYSVLPLHGSKGYLPNFALMYESVADPSDLQSYIAYVVGAIKTSGNNSIIGGGVNTNKSIYRDARVFQKDLYHAFYTGSISNFKKVLDDFEKKFDNKILGLKSSTNKDSDVDYLVNLIAYVVNRICDGTTFAITNNPSYESEVNKTINSIMTKFNNVLKTDPQSLGIVQKCKIEDTLTKILENCTPRFHKIFLDVDPKASSNTFTLSQPNNLNELEITNTSAGVKFGSNPTVTTTYKNSLTQVGAPKLKVVNMFSTSITNSTGGVTNYAISSAMSFMQHGYRPYLEAILTPGNYNYREDEINKIIDAVGMTYDFFIFDITNSNIYGVIC